MFSFVAEEKKVHVDSRGAEFFPPFPRKMESIADVRRSLSLMRAACASQSHSTPLNLSTQVEETGMSFGEWAFAFVRMHHLKRQSKSRE